LKLKIHFKNAFAAATLPRTPNGGAGTVDNHRNTETVIFVKCREFAKMLFFCQKCRSFTFSQEYFVFSQHNLKFIV